jgi:4-hydroxy-tetrahydrodipicolinate synthase
MLRLAEVANIVAVKEASGNPVQIMEIIRLRPPEFRVLSGDDAIALPLMAAGADGVVSVVSNETPGLMRTLIDAALQGDYARARQLQYKLLPLMNANFIESNPIPVKAALSMMGMMEENYRLPLVPMTPGNRGPLRKILEELGLLQSVGVPR